jgi:hypothetical protein
MHRLRAYTRDHRWLAIWLVALALCMKIMVPSGFMVGMGAESLSITICDGRGPEQTRQINLPQSGHSHDNPAEQGKMSDACPYAALGMAALSGTPAMLLVVALAFIMARGTWPPVVPQPALRFFLRPPLRGPPALG